MLKRIFLYFRHRNHDKLRAKKLVLYRAFGYRDENFDYKKHLKGSFWDYVRATLKHKGK